MKERIDRASRSPDVAGFLHGTTTAFEFAGDTWRAQVAVEAGRVTAMGTSLFVLRAPDAIWEGLLAAAPLPGEQSIVHLVRSGRVEVIGDEIEYARHLHLVRAVLEAARTPGPEGFTTFAPGRRLQARGEYHRVASPLGTSDVYVERCGTGRPLLALATAGSDTTQWHGLMTESDVTARYELITVDLPWHGRSTPTFDTPIGGWRLTPESYSDFIVATTEAVGLDRPILVGASMAGAAVIHAVATYPGRFGGAVSCQAGFRVRNRSASELRATDVNQALFVPEWTYGLMNPRSPAEFRKRVWWGYSSGGFGLYAADIDSYLRWDFNQIADRLSPTTPHIAVLSGAYDTTVSPDASRSLAAAIPNSSFQEMPDLGHFPHAEHPARFADYLEVALQRICAGAPD